VRRNAAPTLLAVLLFGAGCLAHSAVSKPRVAVVDGDPIVQMDKPGKMPTLDHPQYASIKQHTDPPFRSERVVGVTLGPTPRMYPIGLLDDYEAVNDVAGGVPYVVARCPMADLTSVLDRRVSGRTLTFEVSGAIWRDTLVLRDRETGTYWSPATGAALSGPLTGETLKILPAPVTTADVWEEAEPASVCLETGETTAVSLKMKLYASSSMEGISGEKTTDLRFPPKERVFFVTEGDEAVAFTAGQVKARKSVAVSVGGRPVTVEWDGALRTPRAYTQVVAVREERPVVPMFWFALVRQFPNVRTLEAQPQQP
jgi:Protein of unknown function (DUF3179)